MNGALVSLSGFFSAFTFVMRNGMGWMFIVRSRATTIVTGAMGGN